MRVRPNQFVRLNLTIAWIVAASSVGAWAQEVEQAVVAPGSFPRAQDLYSDSSEYGIQLLQGQSANRLGDVPHIPEPMFFDMVRELGSEQGELEANVLGLFPLNTSILAGSGISDPFSPAPESHDEGGIEWAPEIEYAIFDGVGLEFELPFENSHLEAYKFAGQFTFGTAFNNHYIHGTQVIVEPYVDENIWDLTFLYLGGIRFDETWSAMAMVGFRSAVGEEPSERTEKLFNLSIFADVCDDVVLGVETNYTSSLEGGSTLLVLPQLHLELCEHVMVQAGGGIGFTDEHSLPVASVRAIYER